MFLTIILGITFLLIYFRYCNCLSLQKEVKIKETSGQSVDLWYLITNKSENDLVSIFSSGMYKTMVLELIICSICTPPYFDYTFSGEMLDGTYEYR